MTICAFATWAIRQVLPNENFFSPVLAIDRLSGLMDVGRPEKDKVQFYAE